MQASASLPELRIILQIIKFGISKYLYLCVEAGFSQIRSHIMLLPLLLELVPLLQWNKSVAVLTKGD